MIPRRLLWARLQLAGWVAGLAAVITVLHTAGGSMRLLHDAEAQPVTAAYAVLRLGALATAWYLLAATATNVAGHLTGRARLLTVADALAVRPVRRLVRAAVGAGLAGTLVLPTGLTPRAPILVRTAAAQASSPPEGAAPPPEASAAPSEPVTLRRLAPPIAEHWSMRPGECFWSIAEAVVGTAAPAGSGRADVTAYWLRLIEANRDALLDPANPDLVFPGQVFRLPPVG